MCVVCMCLHLPYDEVRHIFHNTVYGFIGAMLGVLPKTPLASSKTKPKRNKRWKKMTGTAQKNGMSWMVYAMEFSQIERIYMKYNTIQLNTVQYTAVAAAAVVVWLCAAQNINGPFDMVLTRTPLLRHNIRQFREMLDKHTVHTFIMENHINQYQNIMYVQRVCNKRDLQWLAFVTKCSRYLCVYCVLRGFVIFYYEIQTQKFCTRIAVYSNAHESSL